jgi:hypothetical protein
MPVPAKTDGGGLQPPPLPAPRFPLSGSRTHSTTTTSTKGTETKTSSSSRTETFDGSGIVQVVMTVNGQTKNCTVDLASHTSTCGK